MIKYILTFLTINLFSCAAFTAEIYQKTMRYYLKNSASFVEKTPTELRFADYRSENFTFTKGGNINGEIVRETTKLSAHQSEEEFLTSFEQTGLFSREDNIQKHEASNWQASYLLNSHEILEHRKDFIFIDGQYPSLSMKINIKGEGCKPTRVSLFDTQEIFEQKLIDAGILYAYIQGKFEIITEQQKREFTHQDRIYFKDGDFVVFLPNFFIIQNIKIYGSFIICSNQELDETNTSRDVINLSTSQTREDFIQTLRQCGLVS